LQRKKLELEVEIHALEREKDAASKERLHAARKAIAETEEKLQPLKAAYENEKQRGEELNQAKKKLDELKAKAEDAERRLVCFRPIDLRMSLMFRTIGMTLLLLLIFVIMPSPKLKLGSRSLRRRKQLKKRRQVVVQTL